MESFLSILISHVRQIWRRLAHIFGGFGSTKKAHNELFPDGLNLQRLLAGENSLVKPAAVDSFDINDPNPFGWDVRSLVLPSSAEPYLHDDIEAQQPQQNLPRAMYDNESKYSPWQSHPLPMSQVNVNLNLNLNMTPQQFLPLGAGHSHSNQSSSQHSHQSMYSQHETQFSGPDSFYEEEYVGFVEYQVVKEQFEDEMALEEDDEEEVVGGLFNTLIDGFALDDEMVLSKSNQQVYTAPSQPSVQVFMAKEEPVEEEVSPLYNIKSEPGLYGIKQEEDGFGIHDFSVLSSSAEEAAELLDHPRSASTSDGTQFQCPDCSSSFKVKSYLTRHMKKHLAAKAFMCPFYSEECADDDGKSTILRSGTKCHTTGGFSRRDTFKVHLKALHFIYPPGTKSSMRNSIGGRCAGCFQFFENNAIWLEVHIAANKCTGAVNKN